MPTKYEDFKIGDRVTIVYGKRNPKGNYEDTTVATEVITLKGKKVKKIQVRFSRLWFDESAINVSIFREAFAES